MRARNPLRSAYATLMGEQKRQIPQEAGKDGGLLNSGCSSKFLIWLREAIWFPCVKNWERRRGDDQIQNSVQTLMDNTTSNTHHFLHVLTFNILNQKLMINANRTFLTSHLTQRTYYWGIMRFWCNCICAGAAQHIENTYKHVQYV